jgi:hypothetical protein
MMHRLPTLDSRRRSHASAQNLQTYPIEPSRKRPKSNDVDGDKAAVDKNNVPLTTTKAIDQFDIIVIGLQESTFDIPEDQVVGGSIRVSVPVVQPIAQRGLKSIKKGQKGGNDRLTNRPPASPTKTADDK